MKKGQNNKYSKSYFHPLNNSFFSKKTSKSDDINTARRAKKIKK